jgi:hypothetical protein
VANVSGSVTFEMLALDTLEGGDDNRFEFTLSGDVTPFPC